MRCFTKRYLNCLILSIQWRRCFIATSTMSQAHTNMQMATNTPHTSYSKMGASSSSIGQVRELLFRLTSELFLSKGKCYNKKNSFVTIENTCCILSDPERCHFHNKNFEKLQNDVLNRYDKSILPDKFCSCVRQLLFDGNYQIFNSNGINDNLYVPERIIISFSTQESLHSHTKWQKHLIRAFTGMWNSIRGMKSVRHEEWRRMASAR